MEKEKGRLTYVIREDDADDDDEDANETSIDVAKPIHTLANDPTANNVSILASDKPVSVAELQRQQASHKEAEKKQHKARQDVLRDKLRASEDATDRHEHATKQHTMLLTELRESTRLHMEVLTDFRQLIAEAREDGTEASETRKEFRKFMRK